MKYCPVGGLHLLDQDRKVNTLKSTTEEVAPHQPMAWRNLEEDVQGKGNKADPEQSSVESRR